MAEHARRRILLVNDDRRLAASVRRLLSDEGYEVAVAFDGYNGLEVLAEWPPDLVLLDLIMPRLDGWGFLEAVASRAETSRPLILVWSAMDSDTLGRARLLGATECLRRETTDPDGLLEAIAGLVQGVRSV